jgi:multiple sugar transport system permease protein
MTAESTHSRERWQSKHLHRRLAALGTHATLLILSVVFLVPIAWMVISSLKPNSEIFVFPPSLFPRHPLFSNYSQATRYIPFFQYFLNTVIVSAFTVVGTVVSCVPAAYAFSIMRWRGRDVTFYVVLATIMLPFPVIMIPQYYIFTRIHWIGSLLPLTAPPFVGEFLTPYFSAALAIFLLRQFFKSLPYELVDAARVDGAGHWKVLLRIIVPLGRGAILTVSIFSFLAAWTAFIGPLIFLNKQSTFTLSLGLQQYESLHYTAFNYLMAATTLFCVPVVVLFFVAQRYFLKGISVSGLKG